MRDEEFLLKQSAASVYVHAGGTVLLRRDEEERQRRSLLRESGIILDVPVFLALHHSPFAKIFRTNCFDFDLKNRPRQSRQECLHG